MMNYLFYIKILLLGPHPDDCNSSTTPGDQKREATTKNDNTDTTDNPNNKPTNDITTTEIHDATRDDSTIATIDENTTIKYKTDATETPSVRKKKKKIVSIKIMSSPALAENVS